MGSVYPFSMGYIWQHEKAIWRRAATDTWRFVRSHVRWEVALVLAAAVIAGLKSDLSDALTALQGPGWGMFVLRSLIGGFAVTVGAIVITFLGELLVAPARINRGQLERVSELEEKVERLEEIPLEPKLSAVLQFQNDLAELVIRNAGAATKISARWKEESHTPENHRLRIPSGYQEMAFSGNLAIVQLDSPKDVKYLHVAECHVQINSPGFPPNYTWNISYLKDGKIEKAPFGSGAVSLNPGAPYARLVILIEIQPHSGSTAEPLVLRVAFQAGDCRLLDA
jgi:hypothetical protein